MTRQHFVIFRQRHLQIFSASFQVDLEGKLSCPLRSLFSQPFFVLAYGRQIAKYKCYNNCDILHQTVLCLLHLDLRLFNTSCLPETKNLSLSVYLKTGSVKKATILVPSCSGWTVNFIS